MQSIRSPALRFGPADHAGTTADHYVRLKPIAPGDHVREFGGALCTAVEDDLVVRPRGA